MPELPEIEVLKRSLEGRLVGRIIESVEVRARALREPIDRKRFVRLAGRPFADGATSGMTARVRWSPTRVCIEAIEVPESTGSSPWLTATETTVIASFAPRAAGRATIETGIEERTPLTCSLSPR